jgi:hypothetical protein
MQKAEINDKRAYIIIYIFRQRNLIFLKLGSTQKFSRLNQSYLLAFNYLIIARCIYCISLGHLKFIYLAHKGDYHLKTHSVN